ncbi:MAG: hypothetical protein IH609_11940 [Dehalococcoidia bacterium]|nr:hypothetical protein [Dehalococcoidia bacterium]
METEPKTSTATYVLALRVPITFPEQRQFVAFALNTLAAGLAAEYCATTLPGAEVGCALTVYDDYDDAREVLSALAWARDERNRRIIREARAKMAMSARAPAAATA